VPRPAEELSTRHIGGTCAGIPVKTVVETGEVNWIKMTEGGASPVEECVLGRTVAFSSAAYHYQADFGPFAQRMRTTPRGADGSHFSMNTAFGLDRDGAWATARCPGHTARALFYVDATEYADPKPAFLTASLRAFAEHSVERHHCTDLRLPR
jgi:hypothetical protein